MRSLVQLGLVAAGMIGVVFLGVSSGQPTPAAVGHSRTKSRGRSVEGAPPITAPPESVFAKFRESDREVARRFYKKSIDVKGMPVLASAEVADEALQRTYDIVTHLLAGRPDILEAMVKHGTRLDHHRQGPGLHRYARVPKPPEPAVPERTGAGHRRPVGHQLR